MGGCLFCKSTPAVSASRSAFFLLASDPSGPHPSHFLHKWVRARARVHRPPSSAWPMPGRPVNRPRAGPIHATLHAIRRVHGDSESSAGPGRLGPACAVLPGPQAAVAGPPASPARPKSWSLRSGGVKGARGRPESWSLRKGGGLRGLGGFRSGHAAVGTVYGAGSAA